MAEPSASVDESLAEGASSPIRNERGDLSPRFVASIRPAIETGDVGELKSLVAPLHEADVGDLLEALSPDERTGLVRSLGDDFDFAVLTELDDKLRARLIEALPPDQIVEGVKRLDSDDAVTILEDIPEEERQIILGRLPHPDRAAVSRSLEYPEDSAGRLMQTEFIAVPPFWDVGRTIDYLREEEDLPDEFHRLIVIDAGFHPIGMVALDRLLRSKRPTAISDITDSDIHAVKAADDQEHVARLFELYNLVTAPVVDDDGRLVGVITVDDIVDVIEEEAEEDIRRLAGIGNEETTDAVAHVARSRVPWLLVNVLTGFLAAAVIGLFDGTIEQMVALAVLMPIVASMGGNAGTQAMTVTVRAIATRDIAARAAYRVIGREAMVGLINGLVVALCVGLGAGLWFASPALGTVIAVALIVNIVVAGLVGAMIPLALDRLGIDPAVASGVILTAVTDVTGFFVFLGLAGWWFGFL